MGMFRLILGDDFHDRLEQRLALKFKKLGSRGITRYSGTHYSKREAVIVSFIER